MWELNDTPYNSEGINTRHLQPDQAFISITSRASRRLTLYTLSDDCVRCPFVRWQRLEPDHRIVTILDTRHAQSWRIFAQDEGMMAGENASALATVDHPRVGQFGVYRLHCDDTGCVFSEIKPAVNVNLSFLYFVCLLVIISAAICGVSSLLSRIRRRQLSAAANASPNAKPIAAGSRPLRSSKEQPKLRLRCLDTFRGLAIVLMIFVNSGGGHYWWMEHATWNGLHVADAVFPGFLWIMGVCIPATVRERLGRGVSRPRLVGEVFVRSMKLFVLGLFVNSAQGSNHIEELRIMGVLQCLGLTYGVCATLYTLLIGRSMGGFPTKSTSGWWRRHLYDVELLWPMWVIMAAIVGVHSAVVFWLPVPGCPTGYLGPGGRHNNAAHANCTGGATGYIDRALLSETHLFEWGTERSVYDGLRFDPVGLFGSLLCVVQVFLGVQCGVTLQVYSADAGRLMRWSLWSVGCTLAGAALAGFSRDDGLVPLNQSLWSVSYVLVTAGMSFAGLAVCYGLTEMGWRARWSGAPLRWAGRNALVMCIGHEALWQVLPFRWRWGAMNTHFVLLLENGWNTGMWLLVAWWLYRRRVFVSF